MGRGIAQGSRRVLPVKQALKPEVSGRAFLGLIRHVREQRDAAFVQKVARDAGPATERVFAERIRMMQWYPYAGYIDLLKTLDQELGTGDGSYCRKLGEAAGQMDLGTIFRVYIALSSPERLIRACKKIWPSYHKHAGRMEAIAWAPERTVLRIFDFAAMHPLHCRLVEGWMLSTMRTLGVQVSDDARETHCMSRGAPFHEFVCSWQRTR